MKKLLLFCITVVSVGAMLYSCTGDNSDALYEQPETKGALLDSIDMMGEALSKDGFSGFANDSADCVARGCIWSGGMSGTCVCSGDIEP